MQVTNLDYNDFLGRIAIARVFQGTLRRDDLVGICQARRHAATHAYYQAFTISADSNATKPKRFRGRYRRDRRRRGHPDRRNHHRCRKPVPLEPLTIDEPTLAMIFTVNTSPLSGREGQWLTSRDLRDRLQKELLTNVSIRVENTDTPEAFRVLGRGELQLAILIETMRREGYELMVGKPEIVVRNENGKRLEPLELLVVDCPENLHRNHHGMPGHAPRRNGARWSITAQAGCAWNLRIPSRGLIGLRGQLMTDTRGTAQIHSLFDGGRITAAKWLRGRPARWWPIGPAYSTAFRVVEFPGARRIVHRPGDRSLRRHDRRRKLARLRHGREHHQGKEADEHARVQRR